MSPRRPVSRGLRVTTALLCLGVLAGGAALTASPASATAPGWLDGFDAPQGVAFPTQGGVHVDASGRTVVLQGGDATTPLTVTRLTTAGVRDTTFGTGGSTTIAGDDEYTSLTTSADGSVLLGGVDVATGRGQVTRLTSAGVLDTAFGAQGVYVHGADVTGLYAVGPVVPRPGGTYVAPLLGYDETNGDTSTMIALSATGTPLTTWGSSGSVTLPGVATNGIDRDGESIVTVGYELIGDSYTTVITKLNAAGQFDPAFGTRGQVRLNADTLSLTTVTAFQGAYYLPFYQYLPGATEAADRYRTGLLRLTSTGARDTSYGTGTAASGTAGMAFVPTLKTCSTIPVDVHVTTAAAVMVSDDLLCDTGSELVHRFDPTGRLDTAFASGGELAVDDLGTSDVDTFGWGSGVQPDGKIVLGVTVPTGADTVGLRVVRVGTSSSAPAGSFVPLEPARLLDTRNGLGAPRAAVAGGGSVTLSVAGRGGVPATGASSVLLNVTVTQPTRACYITVYPSGQALPTASNLNCAAGDTRPNLVSVKLGADGNVVLRNGPGGTVQLVADVLGYYRSGEVTAAGAFVPLAPVRLLDTRNGTGAPQARVAGGATLTLPVTGRGGVPATNVSSVVMNVAAVNPANGGYLTVFPAGAARPNASNLNFAAGQTLANLTTVRVGTDGAVNINNTSGGTTDLIADVAGYYLGGTPTQPGTFVSLAPTRLLDTRSGVGAPARAVGTRTFLPLDVLGRGGIPDSGVAAVVMNTTVTQPTGSSTITVRDATSTSAIQSSNLNVVTGKTAANLVVTSVGVNGVDLYNSGPGSVQLIADAAGYFLR